MKHITVTPAEEDEIIVAGIAQAEEPQQNGPAGEEALQLAESRETDELPAEESGGDRTESGRSARRAPAAAKALGKPARKHDDGYRETTLEDLDSAPMPLAQKVVIIAAIVCIIGALVYYFALMR